MGLLFEDKITLTMISYKTIALSQNVFDTLKEGSGSFEKSITRGNQQMEGSTSQESQGNVSENGPRYIYDC